MVFRKMEIYFNGILSSFLSMHEFPSFPFSLQLELELKEKIINFFSSSATTFNKDIILLCVS